MFLIQLLSSVAPAIIQSLALCKLCLAPALLWSTQQEDIPDHGEEHGMGLVSVAARVGGIIAPSSSASSSSPQLQFTVLGLMSLLAGVLNLRLPETAEDSFLDTINDLLRCWEAY